MLELAMPELKSEPTSWPLSKRRGFAAGVFVGFLVLVAFGFNGNCSGPGASASSSQAYNALYSGSSQYDLTHQQPTELPPVQSQAPESSPRQQVVVAPAANIEEGLWTLVRSASRDELESAFVRLIKENAHLEAQVEELSQRLAFVESARLPTGSVAKKPLPTATHSAVSPSPFGVAENGSYYGEPNALGAPKTVPVQGYFRKDGTYVRGHYRSAPRRH